MEKKQFQAESKKLLDLMIHSIYTHKEIFLRELVSNASDAVDKLAYLALTDDKVGMARSDFEIWIKPDKEAGTLTVSDNGIGMSKEDLEHNLGVIARSGSLQFKEKLDKKEDADVDIIGQFGVGFYSAFMVSETVTVKSRAYGADEAYCWESSGADGYTVTSCEKETPGTEIIMKIKEDTEEERYSQFLDTYRLRSLVKKYSDYIRYPIQMEVEKTRQKEKPADAPEDAKPEWETYTETETLNSMVPLWQKNKDQVTEEERNAFYKEQFGDFEDPLLSFQVSVEGAVTYQALLYVPARTPYDFYTRDYQKGLALYSSGVMIMEKCGDLLPEHFRFVKGVVDTQDLSLNLSREMLQQTKGLRVISTNLEKKIKSELMKLQTNDMEQYKTFFRAFGLQLKYGVVADYGAHKDMLRDLLLFQTSHEGNMTTLGDYVSRMPEEQAFVYYAAGETAERIAKLPQAERIAAKGYEMLYLTDEIDEFTLQTLAEQEGKPFKSINDDDALPETEEEKAEAEKQAEENKDVLAFVKETLGDRIKEARISKKLVSHPVCMTAEGPLSLEMEKYLNQMKGEGDPRDIVAQRVLELNPNSGAFKALRAAVSEDPEKAKKYAEILYNQALLIANLPVEDPAGYAELVCSLM
ncbi:MAG: molecular chaperone HtpG [Oscillospiraceae bacterium]|jgi:molecular chaperone HtpG